MSHPLEDVYGLIDRANEHIAELEAVVSEFWSREGQATKIFDTETEPPYGYFCIQFKDPIPSKIKFIIRDAMSCLRSALDQVGAACARASGGSDKGNCYFPFAQTKADFYAPKPRKGPSHIPPEILEIMRSHKAYGDEDGNKGLHALSDVRNINDHRFLTPVGHFSGKGEFGTGMTNDFERLERVQREGLTPIGLQMQLIIPARHDPHTNKVYMAVIDTRLHDVIKFEATCHIAFGEAAGFLHTMEPVHTLKELSGYVLRIIREVEMQAFMMKLFPEPSERLFN